MRLVILLVAALAGCAEVTIRDCRRGQGQGGQAHRGDSQHGPDWPGRGWPEGQRGDDQHGPDWPGWGQNNSGKR